MGFKVVFVFFKFDIFSEIFKKSLNDYNISTQHCWAQHVAQVGPSCCDALRLVGCCWLALAQFWPFSNLSQKHSNDCNRVAKRAQHVAPDIGFMCCFKICDRWLGLMPERSVLKRKSARLRPYLSHQESSSYVRLLTSIPVQILQSDWQIYGILSVIESNAN